MKFAGDKKARADIFTALSLFGQIGLCMAATILITLFAGKWLDGVLGTSPLFLLVFLFIGIGGAIKGMFRLCERFYNPPEKPKPHGKVTDYIRK